MSSVDKGIDVRQSAAQMVEAYQIALKEAAQGLALLAQAEDRLHKAYGQYNQYTSFSMIDKNFSWYGSERVKNYFFALSKSIRRGCWKAILDGMQVNKVASRKRKDDLYKRLENDELPEITLPAIYDQLDAFMQNAQEMAKESYLEVYSILRPDTSHWLSGDYVTNAKSRDQGIGKKVILTHRVEVNYAGNGFRLGYYRRDDIIAIDRVFHLLDGQAFASDNSYNSPLADKIEGCSGTGETDYFSFTCYGNGNLHLTFKRMDLVKLLNQICIDGTTLSSGKFKRQPAQAAF
jgi:hypothetical protein